MEYGGVCLSMSEYVGWVGVCLSMSEYVGIRWSMSGYVGIRGDMFVARHVSKRICGYVGMWV